VYTRLISANLRFLLKLQRNENQLIALFGCRKTAIFDIIWQKMAVSSIK